jgi:integrase
MSVRKRVWRTRDGEQHETWVADYHANGKRHLKTFARRKDAEAFHDQTRTAVRQGTHTPESTSITVAQACADWLVFVAGEGRERSTLQQYRQHVDLHIVPRLGREKLAKLTTPRIERFRDDLLDKDSKDKLSRAMARKVLTSLKSILKDAKRRGNVAQNAALDVKITATRREHKLEVGRDIPSREEIKGLVDHVNGRRRPLVLTAIFAGLRLSELRGLRWEDVDLKRGELHVRQRADRWGRVGLPKSAKGRRTIPIGPFLLNTLKEWKLACPPSEFGLVFPTSTGRVEHQSNLMRDLANLMIAAGLKDKVGRPKYSWHSLRHFYASWCINRKADGGLELPARVVQDRLGHSSIMMTLDRYGHMFPRGDDGAELAAAERVLLG